MKNDSLNIRMERERERDETGTSVRLLVGVCHVVNYNSCECYRDLEALMIFLAYLCLSLYHPH